jgi:hypothetical protein
MWYSRRKNLSRTRAWSIHKNKKNIQRSFEEAIKDIQQKEPPKNMRGASIQTSIKANLTRNFGSNIKNQSYRSTSFIGSIKSTGPTNFTSSTRFIGVIKLIGSTRSIGNVDVMGITICFSILEDITQQYWRVKIPLPWATDSSRLL